MGGKPNKGTPADKRLKKNKQQKTQPSSQSMPMQNMPPKAMPMKKGK